MDFTLKEIEQFRHDTPGSSHCIHLNNAGAGLMPHVVTRAITDYIQLEEQIGGYEASDKMSEEINGFYTSAARLFNCRPSEIAFTANATDSFCRAISAIPFEKGDVILTSREDYISNQITYLAFQKRFGVKLVRTPSLPSGGIDLNALEEGIKKYRPKLVAVTHIPTNSGLVQPAEEIGKICRQHNILYLLDACQSVGQLKLDVQKLHCDFMSVTSRKFLRGPRGAGFLYVSQRILDEGYEPLFIDMRGAEWIAPDTYIPRKDGRRFEDWEFAYALVMGTRAAIDYCLGIDMAKIEYRIKLLSDYLRVELGKIPGVSLYDKGPQLGGIVTFHLRGYEPVAIKKHMLQKKINVVTSLRNYAVIDYDEKKVDWTIRVSPHYYNTREEADRLIEEVKILAKA